MTEKIRCLDFLLIPDPCPPMPYLIDGYNLLHAMGALHGRAGPRGLEKARRRLLGLLGGAFADAAAAITVVFDASGSVHAGDEKQEYQGIHVLFAVHYPQADDLIEELIQHDSAPATDRGVR